MLEFFIFPLVVTVLGGVICHYIIKWLDNNNHQR